MYFVCPSGSFYALHINNSSYYCLYEEGNKSYSISRFEKSHFITQPIVLTVVVIEFVGLSTELHFLE